MTLAIRADENLTRRVNDAIASWESSGNTKRMWAKDASLWTDSGEDRWLGWLDAAEPSAAGLTALAHTVLDATPDGVRNVLLIGMGGSSLAPEVIAQTVP